MKERKCEWCGGFLVSRAAKKFCSLSCSASYQHARAGTTNVNNERKTPNKNHRCKCPRCKKEFSKIMFWTGRGTPKIFCESCRDHPDSIRNHLNITEKETRARVTEIFRKWDEQIMGEQVVTYNREDYTQEELEALIP